MQALHTLSFILFTALCSVCANAQVFNMSSTTVTTCSGSFYDSGGEGSNYAPNSNAIMTFCSDNQDSSIYLFFRSLHIENGFDSLIVYNGVDTSAPVIAIFTGILDSIGIISSNPNNCLTFRFVSDESINDEGWVASIGCGDSIPPPPPPPPPAPPGFSNECDAAIPFCTDSSYSIFAARDITAQVGPHYDCLTTIPNPVWFRVHINQPGSLRLILTGTDSADLDFVCWGPFNSPNVCGMLTNVQVVDCSYSPGLYESIDIPFAQSGAYYMICVTNYSNRPTYMQLNVDPLSTATTICNDGLILDMKAAITSCNSMDASTSLKCKVWTPTPPDTGYLVINTSMGHTQAFVPASTYEGTYEINNIPIGDSINVWAYFTMDSTDIDTVMVNTVVSNLELSVSIQNLADSAVPTGNITAHATGGQPPYSYSWSNGGTSDFIYFLPVGVYNVTVTDARGCVVYADATVSLETTTVLNKAPAQQLSIIPNPATDAVQLQFNKHINATGYLYGTDGKLYNSFAIIGTTETVNIAQLPKGVYIMHVKDGATNTISYSRLLKY
jgi:hypothetical protein